MTDLEQVEIQIDMANKLRALRDNCVKLTASETWKDVIDTGYFKEEAARLVMAKSSNLTPVPLYRKFSAIGFSSQSFKNSIFCHLVLFIS